MLLGSYYLFSIIGRSEGVLFERNRWVWMLLAGTLVGAVSGLYDKHLLQFAASRRRACRCTSRSTPP